MTEQHTTAAPLTISCTSGTNAAGVSYLYGAVRKALDKQGVKHAGRDLMPIPTPANQINPLILVVEDDPMTRMLSVCIEEDAGFKTIAASSADAALKFLETKNDIRVVFTDIEMPGSMNGMQLATLISQRWPAIGLLLTSGTLIVKAEDLPDRSAFVNKPYLVQEVVANLQRLSA
jgi:CheY-like chemotaxis protein